MDDGLEDQHRGAPHQDNYQSSGAEDYMSDWLFHANAAALKQIDPTKWLLDWLQIAEFVAAFVLQWRITNDNSHIFVCHFNLLHILSDCRQLLNQYRFSFQYHYIRKDWKIMNCKKHVRLNGILSLLWMFFLWTACQWNYSLPVYPCLYDVAFRFRHACFCFHYWLLTLWYCFSNNEIMYV